MEHDIYASIDATDGFQFYGGITNFTDQKPALGSNTYPATALGRFFYVGAKVKLPKIL